MDHPRIPTGQRERLIAVGETLYGERWQAPLARELGVLERTMRRWVAEEWPVPDERWEAMIGLLRRRGTAALELAARVEKMRC